MPVDAPTTAPDQLSLGCALARAGQITGALRTLTALPENEAPADAVVRLATLLDCRLARGELADADGLGDRILGLGSLEGTGAALAAHALGELASAQGLAEQAAANHARAGALLGDDDDLLTVPWRSGAALALTRLGDRQEGNRLAHEHLALARGTGSPYAIAQALRTAAATNANGGAAPLLREARTTLRDVPAERLAAQIDVDLALLLSFQCEPDSDSAAVVMLRAAERYACREDLFPLQNRVRSILERLGEEPHRIRSETLATLTPTEQAAARLAADGLTNRRIAGELDVSIKAVEWHLSNVYRKLGVPGRTRLADILGVPA